MQNFELKSLRWVTISYFYDSILIESVDSYELAEKINNAAKEKNPENPHVSEDRRKKHTGLELGDLLKLLDQISTLEYLSFEGLMTIPPKKEDPEDSRKYFKKLKDLKFTFRPPSKKATYFFYLYSLVLILPYLLN